MSGSEVSQGICLSLRKNLDPNLLQSVLFKYNCLSAYQHIADKLALKVKLTKVNKPL